MNAIGTETFHGQHRGTGAGLQYTCNRIAGIVVSFMIHLLLFEPWFWLMIWINWLFLFREQLLRYTRIWRRRFLFISRVLWWLSVGCLRCCCRMSRGDVRRFDLDGLYTLWDEMWGYCGLGSWRSLFVCHGFFFSLSVYFRWNCNH